MKKTILEFYECETDNDLSHYMDDITSCGGQIESYNVDCDREVGIIECTTPNNFWVKFKTTNAFEYLN